jgi:hypothetical protein
MPKELDLRLKNEGFAKVVRSSDSQAAEKQVKILRSASEYCMIKKPGTNLVFNKAWYGFELIKTKTTHRQIGPC